MAPLRISAVGLCVLALAGCSLRSRLAQAWQGEIYSMEAVDKQPVARGCNRTTEVGDVEPGGLLTSDPRYGGWVGLRYVILPNGSVDPGSVKVTSALGSKGYRASQMARSCIYEPAQLRGQPVAVEAKKRFFIRG
jgi:hypothetical protein